MKIDAKEKFPFASREIINLFNNGQLNNVESLDVEPDFGYLMRINYKDQSYRIIYGNDLGVNSSSAATLANDKGHTKFILKKESIKHPFGREFLLSHWAKHLNLKPHNLKKEIDSFIVKNFGYPAYIKPVKGSLGENVFKVYSKKDLARAVKLLEEKKLKVIVVEEPINMPDFRLVVLEDELICAYERQHTSVVGDGVSTAKSLIGKQRAILKNQGRRVNFSSEDPRLKQTLKMQHLNLGSVIPRGLKVTLLPVSNLSAGGQAEDVTNAINAKWVSLAKEIAVNMNLKLCGVDLACDDILDPNSDYSVLEVNSSPGFEHFAAIGPKQLQVVEDLFIRVIDQNY